MAIEDILHPVLSRYMGAPQWVKSCLGHTYNAVPTRVRYGGRFAGFQAEVRRNYTADDLQLATDAKLGHTLRTAIEDVPAFARFRPALGTGLAPRELLAQLPLTSKQDIKANLSRYVSTRLPARSRLEMCTGGSTAVPMRFYSHKHITRPKERAYYLDFDARAGWRPGDVILSLRGRTVRGADCEGGRLWTFEPIKRHLVLSSDHLEPRFMPQYLDALRKWKPAVIQAVPSALYPLACWLLHHTAPDITERIRGIHLTSETTYGFQMDVFRRVFGHVPVLRGYGHTERAVLAATMPDDDRYFFYPLYGHVELVDTKGRPITEPGVLGEIVATSFDNEVMPFVRYRTGDLGVWGESRHPSLPNFPVMERIEGRVQEFVLCRDERIVTVATLGAAHFADLSIVDGIQYEQREAGRLILKVATRHELSADWRRRLAQAVRDKTQGGCDVEVVRVDQIERTARGKQQLLVQHLDVSRYLGAATLAGLEPDGAIEVQTAGKAAVLMPAAATR